MREKQIEKVSQRLFIVTSILAVRTRVIRLAQDIVYLCGQRSYLP